MYVNAKMILVEIVPGIGGCGDKRECERDKFKCDIFDTL
jgi:hypothetical protein